MADTLKKNFRSVTQQIIKTCKKVERNPDEIQLITVTKVQPADVLQSVLDLGYTQIGENRVQEIVQKIPQLSGEKTVHMIGHLQSNKVAKVIPYVDWIQSIDNEKLLLKVDHFCTINHKKINILIQVNTSNEITKFGCDPDQAIHLAEKASQCTSVLFRGFMTIGPLGDDEKENRKSFRTLRKLGEKCKGLSNKPIELSMGMSNDFPLAIEEGSTMIRLGTVILGRRKHT